MNHRYIGNDMTRSSARTAVAATSGRRPLLTTNGGRHPGTLSGLKGQKSARLEHRQGGYYNPQYHTARMSKRNILTNRPNITQGKNSRIMAGRLMDSRKVRMPGSIERITKLIG